MKRALNEARPNCMPRALCVINPGNPTGIRTFFKNDDENESNDNS